MFKTNTGNGASYMPGFKVPHPVNDGVTTKSSSSTEVTHDRVTTSNKLPNSSEGIITPDDSSKIVKLKQSLQNSGFMKYVDSSSVLELKNIFNQVIEDKALNENLGECKSAKRMVYNTNNAHDTSIIASKKPSAVHNTTSDFYPASKKPRYSGSTFSRKSNTYTGNATKLYYFIVDSSFVVVYFSKGSATGGLGWFRDPQSKIQSELLENPIKDNSLANILNILMVLPLRDRDDDSVEKPKEFPWKNGRSLYSLAFIHAAPPGIEVGVEYANAYSKKFLAVVTKQFPSYKLYMGGSAVQETGESITSFDDIFMRNDVAGFISVCFKEELEDDSFFKTRNMNNYIRRHPAPEKLIQYVYKMQNDANWN